ncbi:fatty acyl-CoA reductase wat-like [Bacillus rossius redtenbacheri]|uniref:fatty acyl-CoA reductase wat-like n=1 Tax=Bacillus rossius redtenbacheri TaxID=93214 RepID=UPI002FDEC099
MSCETTTEVQRFYKDCGVFVTGGTGFLGKLTIEKILRSCPDVRKVYVLIRPKKGLSVEERKKTLLDNVMFDRLKCERPDSVDKIVFLAGDCSSPRLGLSDSDYHHLTQHVHIVLHLAATVRFDEKMKVAINTNIKGAMEALNLCRDCISLKAGVFVTTAFSNPNRSLVKEEFYNPPMQVDEILALLDRLNEHELEILSHKITGPWTIPYLFSKAVIENFLFTNAKGLPVSVVRPSMIVSTVKEPVPGWVDNMYGPIAIILGAATGVLRVNQADLDVVIDVIPADIVINCILCAASTTRSNETITIYNATTSDSNPVTIRMIQETLLTFRDRFPVKNCVWYPFMISVQSFKLYTILTIFLHVLPGFFLDLAFRLMDRQPIFMKIYRKIRKYTIILNSFPMKEIIFTSDNTRNLHAKLEAKDKELFSVDTQQLTAMQFMELSCSEARKYLLNETEEDLEEAKALNLKLYRIHTIVKYFLYGLVIWAAWQMIMYFMF